MTHGGATMHDQELVAHDHEVKSTLTLYTGQKNFWRVRQNVDLQLIEHTSSKVIEVVGYSADLGVEAPRIYIDCKKLLSKLDNTEIDEKVNAKREELARMRKRAPLDEMRQAIVQEVSVAFILSRLQIQIKGAESDMPHSAIAAESSHNSSGAIAAAAAASGDGGGGGSGGGGGGGGGGGEVAETTAATSNSLSAENRLCDDQSVWLLHLQPASGDSTSNGKLDMVLQQKPCGVVGVVIPRRKKTTMVDFHKEMRALRADHAQLNQACSNAQRKAGLAVQSTNAFKNMLRGRASLDDANLSIAQKRWIWAGRKVMLQNYVAAVHRRLERYSLSAVPSESITKQGQELKDKLKALTGGVGKGTSMRGSMSSLKLPSLADSSRDARRASRSSKDGSFKGPREMEDFSRSFSVGVQSRLEARQNGLVNVTKAPPANKLSDGVLPVISSPVQ